VSIVRFILTALICASPVLLLWDGLDTQGIVAGVVAVALVITALTLPPGETEFLVSIIYPVAVASAVPALWILFQVIPLKPLAHPIWSSTQAALGDPIFGEISVDPGTSIIRLGEYLALCAIAFLAAAVAVDRGRAESLLFALTAAVAAISLVVIFHDLFLAETQFSAITLDQAIDAAAVGAIIAGAACIRTFERYRTRRGSPQRSVSILLWTFAACVVALIICAGAVLVEGSREIFIAMACGLAALACVLILRRFGLKISGLLIFGAALTGFAFFVFTSQLAQPTESLLIAFAAPSPASQSDASERVLEDAPLVGTGAGTFSALAQIYREIGNPRPRSVASTAAATFAVELGRPMLWLIVTAAIVLVFVLVWASLLRGRDSFYPAMGAGALLTLIVLSFVNAGGLGASSALITAVVLGVALAQSKSRTLQS
jgi:hypothetical protein